MSKIYKSVEEIIGKTPLIELVKTEEFFSLKSKIYAKTESFNPAGSAKDRVAKQMIDDAFENGDLDEETVIIEPTSGNTGIGLAMLGAARNLKVIIVMPDTMSVERIKTIKAYGAQVVLSDGNLGMKGAIDKAHEISKEYEKFFIPGQFDNKSNSLAHYRTTGPEIWDDTEGLVDCFVSGVGTGGTITGVGHYLKEKNKNIDVVAIEPSSSPVLSTGKSGKHKIQGIGAGFVPKVLDMSVIDEIITVSDEEAMKTGRLICEKEGLFVGISSGAALWGAIELAKKGIYKNIVVLLPDTGSRYLSTEMFN